MPLLTTGAGKYAVVSTAPDNPLTLFGANLIGWYRNDIINATGGIQHSSGNITQWDDASGNGKHLTPTGGNVPYSATGFNGKPAAGFLAANGAGLWNTNTFDGLGNGVSALGSVFLVCQMGTGTEANGGLVSYLGNGANNDYGPTGSAAWITRQGSNNSIQTYRAGDQGITSISTGTNYRIGSVFDGTNHTHYVNNTAGGTAACNFLWENSFGSGSPTILIGGRMTGGNFDATSWEGPVAEIVVLKIAPNGTQRTALNAWFLYNQGL